ncbi:hypothetical protein D3C78_880160 [compost metagenome]
MLSSVLSLVLALIPRSTKSRRMVSAGVKLPLLPSLAASIHWLPMARSSASLFTLSTPALPPVTSRSLAGISSPATPTQLKLPAPAAKLSKSSEPSSILANISMVYWPVTLSRVMVNTVVAPADAVRTLVPKPLRVIATLLEKRALPSASSRAAPSASTSSFMPVNLSPPAPSSPKLAAKVDRSSSRSPVAVAPTAFSIVPSSGWSALGPSSSILNTPVPRLIAALSLSPSASVTVCSRRSRLAAARVRVEVSSSLPVLAWQTLTLWVKVT